MPHTYQQDVPMDIYNIRMTAKHARVARSLMNGNLSLGGRRAIEFTKCVVDAAKDGNSSAKEMLNMFWNKNKAS